MTGSLPFNEDAEISLLGALLIDNEKIPEVRQTLPDPGGFYKIPHQRAYKAILALHDRGEPVDQVTVPETMVSQNGKTDLKETAELIMSLAAESATGANARYHARIVRDYARRRQIINKAGQINTMARDPASSLEDIRSILSGFADSIYTGTSEGPFALNPRSAVDLMKEAPEISWQVEGILPVGSSAVLVGDAGVGKSWMSLQLALAIDQGIPWLGKFATRQGRVLIIDEENADALLSSRLKKLMKGAGLPGDGSDLDIEFLTAQSLNLGDEARVGDLDRVLEEKQPNLVIVDSLVRIHRGNENDAGDMARLFGIFKAWIVKHGCSFVFCHHRRKPGLTGNDPTNMFRGSSEIRAFVDTHLDLKPVKGKSGLVTVSHSKSRYAEPIPMFDVEILDTTKEATVIRYAGESKTQAQEKLEEAQEFIRDLAADGEWHGRKEILKTGEKVGFKRDTLDTARKLLIEAEEVVEEKRSRETGIRLPEPSDASNGIYTVGKSEDQPKEPDEGSMTFRTSETHVYAGTSEDRISDADEEMPDGGVGPNRGGVRRSKTFL